MASHAVVRFCFVALLFAQSTAIAGPPPGEGSPPITLVEAMAMARRRFESFQIADEELVRMQLVRDRAWAALLPSLSAGGTFTVADREVAIETQTGSTRVLQRQDTFAGSANATLVLFRGPAIPDLARAYDLAESAAERTRRLQQELAFEVARAFYSALAGDRLVEARGQSLRTAEEHLDAAQQRLAAGLALALDQTRAQLELVSAQEGLTRAQNARAGSHDLLAFYLGIELVGPEELLHLAHPAAADVPEQDTEALIAKALHQRPDLKAAAYDLSAAETAVIGAWMSYLPTLTLDGIFKASQNTGWSGVPESWNMVMSAQWELFDGGLRCAARREQDSALREARLERQLLERSVRQEIRQAVRDLATARATRATARERRRLAAETREAVMQRYRSGLSTSLDLTEADADLNQAKADLVIEELNLALTGLELLRALGREPSARETRSDDDP